METVEQKTEALRAKRQYPIAEIFTSPQGEGLYAGVLMTFVRMAGCCVGKKLTDDERKHWYPNSAYELPVYVEKCTTWAGIPFACDTDFRTHDVKTADEIIAEVPAGVKNICLTGGEPLIHDLSELLPDFWKAGFKVHIETSGTVLPKPEIYSLFYETIPGATFKALKDYVWITVSPKINVLSEMLLLAHEIKLLVDENFDLQQAERMIFQPGRSTDQIIWIQPISYEHQLNPANVKLCLKIQRQKPTWRISSQLHKVWNVR